MRNSNFVTACIYIIVAIWIATSFSIQSKATNGAEVQTAIEKSISKSGVPIFLPKEIPVKKNFFLTAKTKQKVNNYEVSYYQFNKKYKVNSKKIDEQKKKKIMLRVTAKKYATTKQANRELTRTVVSIKQGKKIQITDEINGYLDAGAGSGWLAWNQNNWTFVVQSRTTKQQQAMDLARQIMENNRFPSTVNKGIVQLRVDQSGGVIMWSKGKVVYKMDLHASNKQLIDLFKTSLH